MLRRWHLYPVIDRGRVKVWQRNTSPHLTPEISGREMIARASLISPSSRQKYHREAPRGRRYFLALFLAQNQGKTLSKPDIPRLRTAVPNQPCMCSYPPESLNVSPPDTARIGVWQTERHA